MGQLLVVQESDTCLTSLIEVIFLIFINSCLTSITSCEMLDWMNYKLESRLLGERSTTLDMQMIPLREQEVKRNKEPIDEGEREEWKSWLETQY